MFEKRHGRSVRAISIAAICLAVSAIVACKADEGSQGTDHGGLRNEPLPDAGDAAAEASTCSFPLPLNTSVNTPCASGCSAVLGRQLDAEKQCVRQVLVGCISCAKGCGGAPEGYCYRNTADGRIVEIGSYVLDNLPNPSEWATCSQADSDRIKAAQCP
jgi:hypothetical protein